MQHKPHKAIPKQTAKELEYQIWKEAIARPAVIERDGWGCQCPGVCWNLGTDLDHKLGKGSHPGMKRDIANLQLLCRPCHNNKTDLKECLH